MLRETPFTTLYRFMYCFDVVSVINGNIWVYPYMNVLEPLDNTEPFLGCDVPHWRTDIDIICTNKQVTLNAEELSEAWCDNIFRKSIHEVSCADTLITVWNYGWYTSSTMDYAWTLLKFVFESCQCFIGRKGRYTGVLLVTVP